MLCGFDIKYCKTKCADAAVTSTGRRTFDTGVGYAEGVYSYQDAKYDTFFGYAPRSRQKKPDANKARAENAEQHRDLFSRMVFSFLGILLPSPNGVSSFDTQPPGAVVSMLVASKMLDKAAELVRNDSLDNATKRNELYMALIDFLIVVGVHPATKQQAIFSERVVHPDSVNLLTVSFQGLPRDRRETASSLAQGLTNLKVQSDESKAGVFGSAGDGYALAVS